MSKLKLLETALMTPMADGNWGVPIVIYSEPGMAKTSIGKQLGRKYGQPFERLSPGARGEGAFGVVPFPDKVANFESTVLTYPPPDWVVKLKEGGFLFVDEINTLPQAVAAAGLDLVQEKIVGSYQLHKRVRVFGAANPAHSAANAIEFSAAQANRMLHMDWTQPELESWTAHLLGVTENSKPIDLLKREAEIMKVFPQAFAKSLGAMSGFLKRRPEFQHRKPKTDDPNVSRAWPSLRTLEYATRLMAMQSIADLKEDEIMELVGATIGGPVSRELYTWLTEADLPDPELLLDGKVHYTPDAARLDRTVAVLSSAASTVKATTEASKKKSRAESLWALITKVSETAKDVVIPAAATLINAKLGGKDVKGALDAKVGIFDVIEATGITWRDFE